MNFKAFAWANIRADSYDFTRVKKWSNLINFQLESESSRDVLTNTLKQKNERKKHNETISLLKRVTYIVQLYIFSVYLIKA